jgi:endonuclease/exonuclease/phosphatase family metal-dependent hydrolase
MGIGLGSVNLHCGLDRHGHSYSPATAIGALGTDVILVQENWRPHGRDSIARRAADAHGYHHVAELDLVPDTALADMRITRWPVPDESGAWGIAVLSRLPWREYTTVALGAAPGDVAGQRRAQVVEIPVGAEGTLRVVNTHLTHKLPYGPGQLRRLIRALDGADVPTVIGGDLNMCRPTVHLAAPYRPAVRGRTWPAHRPVAQIDHLLAGPGAEFRDAEVVAEVGSDHRPIRATIARAPRAAEPSQRMLTSPSGAVRLGE